MIVDIGLIATWLALASAVWAVAAALYGYWHQRTRWVESARRAAIVVWPLLTLAVLSIEYALLTDDFSLRYVVNVSSRSMPTSLKITSLWGGQEGSILFWSWLMSTFAFAVMRRRWGQERELLAPVVVVTMSTLIFFIILNLFAANPFERLGFRPADGHGLNPMLRHFGMVYHPPMLYLGFVGFVIPYAFAMAALVTRRTDDRWIRITRRWTLTAWLFLSLGLLLGGRWAYDVLGWGGYWAWDPVENAAFMPWLTGTAFLHAVMIQEKRGMLKVLNVVLITLTYLLVIFGTFITRSGVISSVHSFARSAVGPLFFGFLSITFVASAGLLLRRLDDLRSDNRLESLLSRESVFLFNVLLFLTLTFSVFLGTVFPMASELLVWPRGGGVLFDLLEKVFPRGPELFTGDKITVGPAWFDRVTMPQFALLLFLKGVAPLFAWRKQSAQRLGYRMRWPFLDALLVTGALLVGGVRHPGALFGFWLVSFVGLTTLWEYGRGIVARHRAHGESWPLAFWRLTARNRRRYGGYMIHLGFVCMALGVLGTYLFQQETQGTLARGESLELGDFEITYNGLQDRPGAGDLTYIEADLTLSRNGQVLRTLKPRRDLYLDSGQTMTIPATRSTISEDFYVILAGWEGNGGTATFKLYVNPLVNWLWFGGFVFIFGTLVAAWPDVEAERRATGRQFIRRGMREARGESYV
ncbi:MAG: cytochrome c-type biogenesis CcmF C-terminal domain-containing protein [Anaerolineae bacterium]|jgi:cytochrome c-type biogenesis protein CcmF